MSFKHAAIDLAKRLVRPITKKRVWIEKYRFRRVQIMDKPTGGDHLKSMIESGKPLAAGKIGGVELGVVLNYLKHGGTPSNGRPGQFKIVERWGPHAFRAMNNAGVFPNTNEVLSRFASTFLTDLGETDLLAVWYQLGESKVVLGYAPQAKLTHFLSLESYMSPRPWTAALAGKRVLVVSPFAKTIQSQHAKLPQVWKSMPTVYPGYELQTYRVPMQPQIEKTNFATWFDALDTFKRDLEQRHFDVLLVGAGAWSIPLAVHARRMGKVGIHLGGATQMLFGVRGRRWDIDSKYDNMFNDAWVRPGGEEAPKAVTTVENGCYW
jgi:hypothetical protein